ncbi:MAG: M48 family metallopeptidase, partial [Candidatus Caenarcaniphilales bacterium]|nr:M48 family metallopeptidase [Candidatus Caenarcaniphilales bacterium]
NKISSKRKSFQDLELGEVFLQKYKGAKSIKIRVKAKKQIKVSLPFFMKFDDAIKFVEEKKAWIEEIQDLIPVKNFDPEEEKLLRRKAHAYLPFRLKTLSEKHNLPFKRLSIRASKTRWGSCSSAKNINLSIYLMKLPEHLIDYVILHELAHTIHQNHSKSFWQALSSLLGQEAKLVDKELKVHRIS